MRLTEKQILKQLLDSADQYKPLKFEGFDKDFLLSERARADGVARKRDRECSPCGSSTGPVGVARQTGEKFRKRDHRFDEQGADRSALV